jgi:hypothetical protein
LWKKEAATGAVGAQPPRAVIVEAVKAIASEAGKEKESTLAPNVGADKEKEYTIALEAGVERDKGSAPSSTTEARKDKAPSPSRVDPEM